MPPKPVVLCILDGWGQSDTKEGNAPALAHTPTFDRIMREFPNSTLITHGPDVGLPTGQMGNSEVGHMNIGAGRVVAMDLGQIDLAIESGAFQKNPSLISFINTLKETGGTAHLMGVVSDGSMAIFPTLRQPLIRSTMLKFQLSCICSPMDGMFRPALQRVICKA